MHDTPFSDSQVRVFLFKTGEIDKSTPRSFNLKLSVGIIPGTQHREYSLKILYKVKKMTIIALGIRVRKPFFRKICYFRVFVMYKREKPLE